MKLFQNLFKAKWKNKDPEIRKNALLDLDPNTHQDIFLEIVNNDEVPEIRLLAVKRINNISQLESIAEKNSDNKVKDQARKILSHAYAGSSESSLTIPNLAEKLTQLDDQKILEYVAQHSANTELRRIAINKVTREALLGNLASNDNDPDLRMLAADKIQQKSTLERLYKKVKTKDKAVSTLIKDKLDEIIRAEKEPQQRLEQQKQLCLQLENLGKKGLWERDKLQFDHIIKQWSEISEYDSDLATRFEQAKAGFEQAYQAYLKRHEERLKQEEALIPVKEQKQAIIAQLHELLEKLNTLSEEEPAFELKQQHSTIEKLWHDIQKLPAEIEEEFHAQFKDVSTNINKTLKQHIQNQELIKTFEGLQKDLEKLIAQPRRLTEKSLSNIQHRFSQTFTLSATDTVNKLKSKTSALIQKAEAELNNKQSKINDQFKQLTSEISTMEKKLNEGVLKEAIAARKNANELIESLDSYGHSKLNDVKRQVNSISAQINELANWRSWANTPQKEELCQRVETLIDSHEDPKDIAFIIKQARNEWKKLGPSERDTSQQLWERFQTACDKAYEPCKVYFADEAKQKQANYEKRLAFVEDMEKFIDSADWETIDWKKVESLFRHSRNEWKDLGQTDPKQRKVLNKRFYSAFEKIKDALNNEWNKNIEAKQKIVARAGELESIEDIENAITTAKALQSEWKNAGRIPQKMERELWAEFRKSCDAVFQRREELKDQEKQALENRAEEKTGLCNQLDKLLALPLAELYTQRGSFEKIVQEFRNFGSTDKQVDDKLNKRIDEILHVFERKIESGSRMGSIQQLNELQNIIKQLEKLEASIESSLSPTHINEEVEATNAALDAATCLPTEWKQSIDARLDQAISIASTQNFAETLKASIDEKAEDKKLATIMLEIIGDVETPAEFANDRLSIQTQRLNDKLQNNDNNDDEWQTFVNTESKWWLCGPTSQQDLASYNERRSAAIQNLKNEFVEELKDYN